MPSHDFNLFYFSHFGHISRQNIKKLEVSSSKGITYKGLQCEIAFWLFSTFDLISELSWGMTILLQCRDWNFPDERIFLWSLVDQQKEKEKSHSILREWMKCCLKVNPNQFDVWEGLSGLRGGGSGSPPPCYLGSGANFCSKIMFT